MPTKGESVKCREQAPRIEDFPAPALVVHAHVSQCRLAPANLSVQPGTSPSEISTAPRARRTRSPAPWACAFGLPQGDAGARRPAEALLATRPFDPPACRSFEMAPVSALPSAAGSAARPAATPAAALAPLRLRAVTPPTQRRTGSTHRCHRANATGANIVATQRMPPS